MKKLLLLSLLFHLVVAISNTHANSLFDTDNRTTDIVASMVFKGAHDSNIIDLSFNTRGDKLVSLSSNGTLKLWNLSNLGLLASENVKDATQLLWLSNSDIFVVMAEDRVVFYKENFDKLGEISSKNFGSNFIHIGKYENKPYLIIKGRQHFKVVDEQAHSIGGAELNSGYNHSFSIPSTSLDDKYLVFYGYDNQYKVYDAANFEHLRNMEFTNALTRPSKNKFLLTESEVWSKSEKGLNQTNLHTGQSQEIIIDGWESGNINRLIPIHAVDETYLLVGTGSRHEAFNYIIMQENGVSPLLGTTNIPSSSYAQFHQATSLFATVQGPEFRLYDLSDTFPATAITADEKTIASSLVETETTGSLPPAFVTTEATKSTKKNKHKKALDIIVQPSVNEGIAPLNVTFLLDSTYPELVEATYSFINGEEKIHEGIPLHISVLFKKPGKHTAFFAFRGKNGEIVKQQSIVEVREESFEDYKKKMLGN